MRSQPGVAIEDVIGGNGHRLGQGNELSARQVGHHTDRMHASCIGGDECYYPATAVAAFKVEQMIICPGSDDPRGERVVRCRTHWTGRDHVMVAPSIA